MLRGLRYTSRSEHVSTALRSVWENWCFCNSETSHTFTWNLGKVLGRYRKSCRILANNFTKDELFYRYFSVIFLRKLGSFRRMRSNFQVTTSLNFTAENKNEFPFILSIFFFAIFPLFPVSYEHVFHIRFTMVLKHYAGIIM